MNKMQRQVVEFNRLFNLPIAESPSVLVLEPQFEKVREEFEELQRGIRQNDIIQVVDGVVDLIYSTIGVATICGFNIEPFYDEVHKTNMTKIRNGPRIVKPAQWEGPRIREILETEVARIRVA